MGHYTVLSAGTSFQVMAKNLLPVTWLAPFVSADRTEVRRQEGGDTWMAQLFRVSRNTAIERYLWAIEKWRDNLAVWQYLRPMETICAALEVCHNAAVLELDLVDFIRAVETNTQRVEEGPREFREFVLGLSGDAAADLSAFEALVNGLRHGRKGPIADLDFMDKTMVFFGDYTGAGTVVGLNPLGFFDEEYWVGTGPKREGVSKPA